MADTASDVAGKFGVRCHLDKWKDPLNKHGTKVLPGKRWWSPQGDGVARLKPELERVKEKHEIPNKTAAYFAKDFGFMRTRQDPLKVFTMCEAFEISRRAARYIPIFKVGKSPREKSAWARKINSNLLTLAEGKVALYSVFPLDSP